MALRFAAYVDNTLDGQFWEAFEDPHTWVLVKGGWGILESQSILTAGIAGLARYRIKDTDLPAGVITTPPASEQLEADIEGDPLLQPSPAPTKPKRKNWFHWTELDCKGIDCECIYKPMSSKTLEIANRVREKFGKQWCNSGYRCPVHNATVKKAARTSYHTKSRAMDLRPGEDDVTPAMVYAWLCSEYPGQYGFGLYDKFVHIDDRTDSFARKPSPGAAWESFELDHQL